MLHPKLSRFPWRMQRIREQQQSVHQLWLLGAKHCGLPPSIRMTAQKDSSTAQFSQRQGRVFEAVAISLRLPGPRRTVRTILAKRQIAAERTQAGAGERSREG